MTPKLLLPSTPTQRERTQTAKERLAARIAAAREAAAPVSASEEDAISRHAVEAREEYRRALRQGLIPRPEPDA